MFDIFFLCEEVDLTDHTMKVCWDRDVTFWIRRSEMRELSELDHMGDSGMLVMSDGSAGRDGVFALFADVQPRREEETR